MAISRWWLLPVLGILGWALGKTSTRRARILDRRQFARLTEKAQRSTRTRTTKPWALVLHQMGFSRGSDPEKYDRVTAHYKILPDGTIVWSWDDNVRLPASSGLNQGSWAVEFVGNFPSRAGSQDPQHFYKPGKFGAHQLTSAQVQAGRDLIDHLIARGLTKVLAHRQSGAQRQNDPGPDIWYRVGEWGVRERGLSMGGPGYSVGRGRPIPETWRTWGDDLGGVDVPAVV